MVSLAPHYTYAELQEYLQHKHLPEWRQRGFEFKEHINDCQPCWQVWNRLRWDQASGSQGLMELRSYLGHDFQPYLDSSWALANEWYQENPQTPDEVAHFYKTTSNYLYNLIIWYESGDRYRFDQDFEQFHQRFGVQSVMDYGCGVGTDGLLLLEKGYDVTFVDYDCPSTQFLKWRLEQRELSAPIIDVETITKLPSVDMFWAIDVLEHMVDPLWTVRALHPSTKVFVHLSQFSNRAGGRHPFHFPFREWQLSTELRRHGFKRVDWPLLSVWVRN